MEGFGSIISALTGACHGTTSYSNMMGFITHTGVRDGNYLIDLVKKSGLPHRVG